MRLTLYAGPTLGGLSSADLPSDVDLRPPARRGAFDAISLDPVDQCAVALVDGIFGTVPAVAHREIIRAMRLGIAVWGLSSLGAIRAAELDHVGMRGYGRV